MNNKQIEPLWQTTSELKIVRFNIMQKYFLKYTLCSVYISGFNHVILILIIIDVHCTLDG